LPGSKHQGKISTALSLTGSNKLDDNIKTKISVTLHKCSSIFCRVVNTTLVGSILAANTIIYPKILGKGEEVCEGQNTLAYFQ